MSNRRLWCLNDIGKRDHVLSHKGHSKHLEFYSEKGKKPLKSFKQVNYIQFTLSKDQPNIENGLV